MSNGTTRRTLRTLRLKQFFEFYEFQTIAHLPSAADTVAALLVELDGGSIEPGSGYEDAFAVATAFFHALNQQRADSFPHVRRMNHEPADIDVRLHAGK